MANDNQTTTTSSNKTTNGKTPSPWQWIINYTQGPIILPAAAKTTAVSGTPIPDSQPLVLHTGANLVDGKKWAALRAAEKAAAEKAKENGVEATNSIEIYLTTKIEPASHPKRAVENVGSYQLVEGPGVASRTDPLAGIDDAKASEVVREILDLEFVRRLLQIEKRPGVAEALVKRRDQLARGVGAAA